MQDIELLHVTPVMSMNVTFKVADQTRTCRAFVEWSENRVYFQGADDIDLTALEKAILSWVSPSTNIKIQQIPDEILEKINRVRSGEYKKEISGFQEQQETHE